MKLRRKPTVMHIELLTLSFRRNMRKKGIKKDQSICLFRKKSRTVMDIETRDTGIEQHQSTGNDLASTHAQRHGWLPTPDARNASSHNYLDPFRLVSAFGLVDRLTGKSGTGLNRSTFSVFGVLLGVVLGVLSLPIRGVLPLP